MLANSLFFLWSKAGIEPARLEAIGFWDRRVYQFHHFGKAECIIGFRFSMVKS